MKSLLTSASLLRAVELEDPGVVLGTNTTEVLQIADDSGLELLDLLQLYQYLTTPPDAESANQGFFDEAETVVRKSETEPCLTDYYQQYLYDWLKENNVNIFDQPE